jgi:hypothetical protein
VFAGVSELPAIRMVNWFEWDKFETEVNARVDWTVTQHPQIVEAFRAALPATLQFADAKGC